MPAMECSVVDDSRLLGLSGSFAIDFRPVAVYPVPTMLGWVWCGTVPG